LVDWVTLSLERSATERERRAVENELRLHRITMMRAFAADLWKGLQAQVHRDIERYEMRRSRDDSHIAYSDLMFSGFSVGTDRYPIVYLALQPDQTGLLAHAEYSFASAYGQNRNWSLRIEVKGNNDKDEWYVRCEGQPPFTRTEQLSAWLLDPLTNPHFKPPDQS